MIRVEHLTKQYGTLKAIDDLTFSIERGEIVGFLGPNGAGKTTTMRILAGSLGADQGRALIDGHDVFEEPEKTKSRIGYLPEFPPLYTDMTVRGFLTFCGRIKGAPNLRENVEEVIERVGLKEVSGRLIQHLSKGYRQRVGIAQAMVHRPQVLILDEPASGLDPGQRVEIRQLVKDLANDETTILLSTHVLPEVEAICGRVIIIHQGKIVAQNAVSEIANTHRAVSLRVARPDDALFQRLQAIAGVSEVTADGSLYKVRADSDIREQAAAAAVPAGLLELRSVQDLEDIFLQLTSSGDT